MQIKLHFRTNIKLHYQKLESGGYWIEYAVAVITAAKCLAAVMTVAAYSIQLLPLSNFFCVI
jgi:hypothetical protein